MIEVPEISVERIAVAAGSIVADNASLGVDHKTIEATGFPKRRMAADGESLESLFLKAAADLPQCEFGRIGAVVVATFSAPDRFPSLAVRLASALGVPPCVPAIDLQAACSAYPYAIYAAGRLAVDTGRKVLLFDGDLQSALTDPADMSTAPLFSDAATVSVVSSDPSSPRRSFFSFLSRASGALSCPAGGPVRMDGFGVFSFVAAEVSPFLSDFLQNVRMRDSRTIDVFAPHQANMYMVRRLAKSLGLSGCLAAGGEVYANTGSCSIPLSLAHSGLKGRALLAGFGAGLSAAAATVEIL